MNIRKIRIHLYSFPYRIPRSSSYRLSSKMASVFNVFKTFLIPSVKAQDEASNPQEELKVFIFLFTFLLMSNFSF